MAAIMGFALPQLPDDQPAIIVTPLHCGDEDSIRVVRHHVDIARPGYGSDGDLAPAIAPGGSPPVRIGPKIVDQHLDRLAGETGKALAKLPPGFVCSAAGERERQSKHKRGSLEGS
jgi:hypothetical protein